MRCDHNYKPPDTDREPSFFKVPCRPVWKVSVRVLAFVRCELGYPGDIRLQLLTRVIKVLVSVTVFIHSMIVRVVHITVMRVTMHWLCRARRDFVDELHTHRSK